MEGGKEGNMEGRKKGRETSRQGHVKRDSILPKSILANITWMARLLGLFCFVFFLSPFVYMSSHPSQVMEKEPRNSGEKYTCLLFLVAFSK